MILGILEGSHLGNIPVKPESHWPKGLREDNIFKQIIHVFYF